MKQLRSGDLAESIVSRAIEWYGVLGRHDVDIAAFQQDVARTRRTVPFAVMGITEAFDYDGVAVATTLGTAETLLRCPGPVARYFYVWDLEWAGHKDRSFEEYLEIYRSDRLRLVARSEADRRVIEDCWNVRVSGVVEDCDIGRWVELIRRDRDGEA